jgi:hypothetical protein
MDSQKIKGIIIGALALFAALYLGITAATAQFETIAWVVGVSTIIICLALGRKIWLLIPFLGALNLTLMIPGQPTTMQVAQALVVGFSVLMLLVRKLPFRLQFTELELWIGLLTVAVVQVYARNPTGLNLFGDSTVGGRPYILYLMTLIAALLLAGLRVPAGELRTAMKLSIIGGILNVVAGFFGWMAPAFGHWFGFGASPDAGFQNEAVDTSRAGRVNFIVFIPITLANWVSSFVNPMKGCFRLRWAPLILLSLAFAAVSGYRNVIGAVFLTYLVGIFYHGRMISVITAGFLGFLGLAFLALANYAMPFPPNVQRSLSFLPGTWDAQYAIEAQGSTEWRTEIWKEVLTTDRWIANKTMGDGLGFTAAELAAQMAFAEGKQSGQLGVSGFDAHREAILANGDYHSGPVSAIRTIGYVGLAIMALAQLRLVVHAHRQIKRCRGTEWFSVTLFFCIPIVWMPIFFWFIFGGFSLDGPAILMAAGMLRMLENNLPLPAYVKASRVPYVLNQQAAGTLSRTLGAGMGH